MGHGSSFPWLSSATGRPATEDSFTVEVTGKDCWPATLAATAALKKTAIRILANSVARFISLHGNLRKQRTVSRQRAEQPAAQDVASQNVAVFRSVWLSTTRDGQQTFERRAKSVLRLALAARSATRNAGGTQVLDS